MRVGLPQAMLRCMAAFVVLLVAPAAVSADETSMPQGMASMAGHEGIPPAATDGRTVVHFPPAFKQQELSNMRSHLEALQQITAALAKGDFQAASNVAAARLTRGGMSQHDRHQAAQYMPPKMLQMGRAMHHAAGHFAQVAQDADVTGDLSAALKALAAVEARCTACHASYRME